MNVGSLFSGIGGFDLGLERAGMRVAWQCEADEWRRLVLGRRFPGLQLWEDVRHLAAYLEARPLVRVEPAPGGTGDGRCAEPDGAGRANPDAFSVDLLCGGFPCQDLSVAGRRAGLAGERSGLFFEFARIAESLRPEWLLIENVPGLLSSNGGRDFGELLGTLADIGYGVGWRILDSRFFGVPQRRRRVFILAHVSGGRAGAERCGDVLSVGSRCQGHSQARGEAREGVAGTLGGGSGERGWAQDTERMTFVADTLTSGSHPGSNMPGRRREDDTNIVVPPLVSRSSRGHAQGLSAGHNTDGHIALCLNGKRGNRDDGESETFIPSDSAVRRLTPRECERLQGFPDDWTAVGPDSRRYAALGDAVTVPVAEWIGRRLAA